MNAEFFEALAMLEKERGLPADYLLEKIKKRHRDRREEGLRGRG